MKEKLLSNKINLIIIAMLIAGIAVGVYLIQFQQIFKPKASININQAFEIKDDQGNIINCDGTNCYTNSFDISIKVKDKSVLEQ